MVPSHGNTGIRALAVAIHETSPRPKLIRRELCEQLFRMRGINDAQPTHCEQAMLDLLENDMINDSILALSERVFDVAFSGVVGGAV